VPENRWIVLGLFLFAAAVTGATTWLVTRRHSRSVSGKWSFAASAAGLRSTASAVAWSLVVFLGGLIAARYIERLPSAALGYAGFSLVAFSLSSVRALLYRRVQERREADRGQQIALRQAMAQVVAFVALVVLLLVLAAIPIAASDLFRRPYSPLWRTINRTLDRLKYTYNPSGGGEAPSFPPWSNPGDGGLDYRDVTLATADGLRLAAWYVPASRPSARTVLLAHGLQDSKWTLLRLIPWLHNAGYNVLAFDFRGHGQSDERPTTVGREEVLDVQAALDWLDAAGVGHHVAGLGMSLGAAALVNTAAQDSRLKALILDSLFAEWKNVDYARGYGLPPEWLVPGVPDPVEVIRRVHIPILIIHGTADILTRVDHALRLYQAANEPRFLWINDSGHAWSAWTYPEEYQERVLGFLETALN